MERPNHDSCSLARCVAAAVSVPGGGAENIWVKQLDTGPFTRLTNDGGQNYRPAWSRDCKSLTFVSDADGIQKIFKMRADGTGGRRVVARAFTNADEGSALGGRTMGGAARGKQRAARCLDRKETVSELEA